MHNMLNEFYEFIARKINYYFQAASDEGTLIKGESFCLKLDDEDMVYEVTKALRELAEANHSMGEYTYPCGDGSIYKTYTIKVIISRSVKFNTNPDFFLFFTHLLLQKSENFSL